MATTTAKATLNYATAARKVLAGNTVDGKWTLPTSINLYPHQWLWDGFFIAIGLRHDDVERAQEEVRSPFRAQWKNGMVPHVIFSDTPGYHAGPEMWQSTRVSRDAPKFVETTGVSQPPVAAEATVRIGEFLNNKERKTWYAEMYPKILAWHQWWYRERDPRGDGMVRILLSWESGMDDSAPLMEMLHKYAMSRRVQLMKATGYHKIAERRRKDTKQVPASERISTLDVHAIYDLIRSMRRKNYDYKQVIPTHKFQVEDLAVNCILIRANQHLKTMADELGEELPADIKRAMRVAPHTLETMWDDDMGFYLYRDAISGKLIPLASSACFLALYALELPKDHVKKLVEHLHDSQSFNTKFPVPSTPLNSPYFNPKRYWQGPTWVNLNWMIIDGLRRNGEHQEAERLKKKTLAMVEQAVPTAGFHEYYSPLDGDVAGAPDFSWSAALYLDLLEET